VPQDALVVDARGTQVAESRIRGQHRACAWHAALAALVATGHIVRKGVWYEARPARPARSALRVTRHARTRARAPVR
jgi:hypothetical protein